MISDDSSDRSSHNSDDSDVEKIMVGDNGSKSKNEATEESEADPSKQLEQAMKILTDFQNELQKQNEANKSVRNSDSHLPDILKGPGLSSETVFQLFSQIIAESEFAIIGKLLSEKSETNIQAAGLLLKNLIASLPDNERIALINKIKEETTLFLSKLYRFSSNCCRLHLEDEKDSAVFVAQRAISLKYDQFETEGYLDLNDKQPVIYISQAGPASLAAQICTKLGLPISCIAVVPTTATENAIVDPCCEITGETKIENQENESLYNQKHEMNCAALDRMIREDVSMNKKPCIVIANAGSPALGHDDPIHLLRVVCNKYKVWLHVRGPNLSTKCLSSSNIPLIAASKADSITLKIGEWLGVPLLPTLTLLRNNASFFEAGKGAISQLSNSNFSPSNWSYNLSFVSIWLSLLSLGHKGVTEKATLAQDLVRRFVKRLGDNPNIDISVKKPQTCVKLQQHDNFKDLVQSAERTLTQYSRSNPILVCFRLAPTEAIRSSITEPLFHEKEGGKSNELVNIQTMSTGTIPEEDEQDVDQEAVKSINNLTSKTQGAKGDKSRSRSPRKSPSKKSKKERKSSKSSSRRSSLARSSKQNSEDDEQGAGDQKNKKKKKKGKKNSDGETISKETSREVSVEQPGVTADTNLDQSINGNNNSESQDLNKDEKHVVADGQTEEVPQESDGEASLDEFLQDLYDSLNVRLYESIQNNIPRIQLDAVSLQERIFLRFTPIVSATRKSTDLQNIETALDFIEKEVDASTKLITQIQAIRSAVSQSDNLDYYCDPDSFSLGLLQIVPTFLQHIEISGLSNVQSDDLDRVNKGALGKIAACDSLNKLCIVGADTAGNGRTAIHLKKILSLSAAGDGHNGHPLNLKTIEKNIHKLVSLISKYGHESERDLLELKEFTKSLIEAKEKAELEIEKVKTKVMIEETSVVQRIPIVGGIFTTIFGAQDEQEISRKMVGRSFDVKTGKMHSTKKTYTTRGQVYETSESTAEDSAEDEVENDGDHRREGANQNKKENGENSERDDADSGDDEEDTSSSSESA